MSITNPEKKPTYIPSVFPRINPNEATKIINRLGEMPAKEIDWKTVVCKTKHMEININKTIFLGILIPQFQYP